MTQPELHASTLLSLCTARIQSDTGSVGTGFFFQVPNPANATKMVPLLITNNHVLDGAKLATVAVSTYPFESTIADDGSASAEDVVRYEIPLSDSTLTRHMDAEIDLCAISVAPIINFLQRERLRLKHFFLNERHLLDAEARALVRVVEPLLMVGYPNGLWDEKNNRPLIRRGSTASCILLNWNNRREFVIDMACYPGSSGSPVFIYEDGMKLSGRNSYGPGTRAVLVGVLYAGPTVSSSGVLKPAPIPTNAASIPVVSSMMHLGYAIHAEAALEIARSVAARAAAAAARQP